MILPLAIPYWATGLLVGAFLVVCVILMLVVLIQRPQGGGLSGAFGAGGGGAGQTTFGTKTGDALTMATIGMFVLYLIFAVGLNFATRPENIDGAITETIQSADPEDLTIPIPIEGTGGAATIDDAAAAEADTAEQVEQAASEILNDAQDAASDAAEGVTEAIDNAVESTTPPTEQPAEQPAEQPTGDGTPPTL